MKILRNYKDVKDPTYEQLVTMREILEKYKTFNDVDLFETSSGHIAIFKMQCVSEYQKNKTNRMEKDDFSFFNNLIEKNQIRWIEFTYGEIKVGL